MLVFVCLCFSEFVSGCGSACLCGCCFGSSVSLYVLGGGGGLFANRSVFAEVASSRLKPVECEGVSRLKPVECEGVETVDAKLDGQRCR